MRHILYCAVICLLVLSACQSAQRAALGKLLMDVAGEDATIDRADWLRITQYVEGERDALSQFYRDGRLDEQALIAYIRDYFGRRREARQIRFAIHAKPLTLRVYVEQSGSMRGYHSREGDGALDAAVKRMANNAPGPVEMTVAGQEGYTDFREIFTNIMRHTPEGTVSVLVTDMIYSVEDMEGVNPQKIFSDIDGMINAVFKPQAASKSMIVVRMSGSFHGVYYAYDGSATRYRGRRPYYIVLAGSNDDIHRLLTERDSRMLSSFQQMPGYEDMYCYTAGSLPTPYSSLLLAGKDIHGRFRPERGQSESIHSLYGMQADAGGDIQLALCIDMSGVPADPRYIADPRNWHILADDPVSIRAIRPLTAADRTPAQRKYTDRATHVMLLSAPRITHRQEVTVALRNRLPQWVAAANTDDDRRSDARTTFALRYLMQGIYDSYRRAIHADEPLYFDIRLQFDN